MKPLRNDFMSHIEVLMPVEYLRRNYRKADEPTYLGFLDMLFQLS